MDELDKILNGGGGQEDSEHEVIPVKQSPALTTLLPERLSGPLTVMGIGNTPVILEDPVRFRKDIQAMVMAVQMKGLPSEAEIEVIEATGTMIEIATVRQMYKAAYGDLDSYKYMMDRVLGKPVNMTNTVSMSVSYEQVIAELDPDEIIKPKRIFSEEITL